MHVVGVADRVIPADDESLGGAARDIEALAPLIGPFHASDPRVDQYFPPSFLWSQLITF